MFNKPKKQGKILSTFDFFKRFPDEKSAYEFICKIMWPKYPICPFCSSSESVVRANPMYHFCIDCRKSYTIRTNTIFHRSHIPLQKWLYALYVIATDRRGISSSQLARDIGIRQPSAWFMLQRIRAACLTTMDFPLIGIVEVDEVYLGGKEKNKHEYKKRKKGRGAVGKIPVLGMRSRHGSVFAKVIENTDKETIQNAIKEQVSEGSVINTDEHRSYIGIDSKYVHKTINHSKKEYVKGNITTNGIESVWAALKNCYYGTHHSYSKKYASYYVAETVFRLNEGKNSNDTFDRLDQLLSAAIGVKLTHKMLKEGTPAQIFYGQLRYGND